MPQSQFILLSIAIAFLVFITMRGELPRYAAIFVGPVGGSTDGKKDASNPAEKVNDAVSQGTNALHEALNTASLFKGFLA